MNMMNKVMKWKKAVKSGVKKLVDNRKMLVCALSYGMMQANMMICYAKKNTTSASNNSVTSGLNSLETLVTSIISAAGMIYLAKSVMEFASAYQQSDSSGMNSALKGIIGGGMMAGVSTIITILNFKS